MDGKVIAVTGGAQGIGFETVKLLVKRGCKVSLCDLDDSALKEAEAYFKEQGKSDQVTVHKVNVAHNDEVEQWIKKTVEWAGQKLDGAANIAGINGPEAGETTLAGTSDNHWHAVVNVNINGMFHCMRAELNNINDGGSIVCTTSVQGEYLLKETNLQQVSL